MNKTVADLTPLDLYGLMIAAIVTVLAGMWIARRGLELYHEGHKKDAYWYWFAAAFLTLVPTYTSLSTLGTA